MTTKDPRPLTGRKVFAITVAAFGVVIGANMALTFAAIDTFPGLEVKNGYVASQSFDRERAAQEALGWTARIEYEPGRLTLLLTGPDGLPVQPAKLGGVVGRPTTEAADQELLFAPGPQGFTAPLRLEDGNWDVNLHAVAQDGTAFRQRLQLHLGQRG